VGEYDIYIIDEDFDNYYFMSVDLNGIDTVDISFLNEELTARLITADGRETRVEGILTFYLFTVNNLSDYDIYAIYISPVYENYEPIDILPYILEAGDSFDYNDIIFDYELDIDEWNFYVVDTDGDESVYDDVFLLWELEYVNIDWDYELSGYVCEFVY
jgi:hypothetical protein